MGATSVGCGPFLVAHNRFRVVLPPLFWRAARRTNPVDPGDPSPAVCSLACANLSGTPVDSLSYRLRNAAGSYRRRRILADCIRFSAGLWSVSFGATSLAITIE